MRKDFKDLDVIEDTSIEEIPETHITVKFMRRATQLGLLLMSAWFAFGSLFPPILFEEKPKPAIKQFLIKPQAFGPVKIGMPLWEAQNVLGLTLKKRPVDLETAAKNLPCYDVMPFNEKNVDLKAGYSLLISADKVVRADISTDYFMTANQAKVGMTEEALQAAYGHKLVNELDMQLKMPDKEVSALYDNQLTPAQIQAQQKLYRTGEHVWSFTPEEGSDYRIVFGTKPDAKGQHMVYHIQAGIMPEVALGCPE